MNANFEYVLPSFIFCFIDILVLRHANKEKAYTDKQKVFNIFGFVILLQQIASTIMTVQQRDAAHVGFITMNLCCIVLFCCMTASSQSLIRYTTTLEKDGDQASVFFKTINAIPLIIMIVTCILSPWTHWVFYIDETTGMYQRGTLFILQIILPYLYFFIEMGYIVRQKMKGKRVSLLIIQFVGFFVPSLLGVVIQMMGFVGGYSSIGISCGMIILYLDLYIDEMNNAKKVKEFEAINAKLNSSNKNLLRASSISNFFISSFSTALYCDIEKENVLVLQASSNKINKYKGQYLPFDETLDTFILENVHPDDRELALSYLDKKNILNHLKDSESVTFNFRYTDINRESFFSCIIIRGEDDHHIGVGFKNIEKEIEEQVEYQKELQNALTMAQEANEAKTAFLFNMSHDIRTPMNAIIGFTNMAMKHIDDKERVIDSLNKTQGASELLLSLINSILDMSRIESGNITLEENEVDITYTFIDIESTMMELAKSKNIDLSFEIGEIKDRYVLADVSRCIRVFVNIITNAVKYTPDGGCVKVKCEQIDSKDGIGSYKYTFSDNGIGISEEFQKRLFEPFSREETTTVSGIQGTGLGLAVCNSFIHAMGGTIECESKQGKGTTFIVVLPFKIQEGATNVPQNNSFVYKEKNGTSLKDHKDLSKVRALIVEDNELNLEIAEDILSEEGMTVESATDGSFAVEILKEKGAEYYDFILMDIQMPIMDGYEATKKIRAMYPDADIPIIALSANAFAEDKAASILAGMNDHIAKPINIDELKTVIAKFI